MKTIVITRPAFFDGETDLVNSLFLEGMERLHLRKPGASEEELAAWLQDIDSQYYGRIVMHDCFPLAKKFALGGVHLNSRNPEAPQGIHGMTVSRSCHSIREVIQHKSECDYLFLSPIYDSISKEGYGRNFTITQLQEAAANGIITPQVIALGGIGRETLPLLRPLPFGGCAFLGAIWGQNLSSAEVFVNFAYYLKEMATWQ